MTSTTKEAAAGIYTKEANGGPALQRPAIEENVDHMSETLTCRLDGDRTIGYAQYGDPEGFPLIFHHGWPGSHHQGSLLHEPAARMGVRVIAVDRPGIGNTRLEGIDRVLDFALAVHDLADALGIDRFHVLGVSGGGPYTLACAAIAKDRMRGVGVCCGAPPLELLTGERNIHFMYRLMMRIHLQAPRLTNPAMELIRLTINALPSPIALLPLRMVIPKPDREALKVRQNRQILLQCMKEAFQRGTGPVIEDALRIQNPWGFALESIEGPVIFWHGGMDWNIPLETARLMIHRIPLTITHVYASDGHYSLPMKRAQAFLEHLSQTP